jgi:hypothetical protein
LRSKRYSPAICPSSAGAGSEVRGLFNADIRAGFGLEGLKRRQRS